VTAGGQPVPWRLVDQGQGPGEARLVETNGHHALIESTLPFAAGALLIAVDPATGVEYRIKVRGGRRLNESWFRIEGRFVTLTKPERERLMLRLSPKPEV
jgi:hypothetical protein